MRLYAPGLLSRRDEVVQSRPSPEEHPVRYFLIEAWLRRVDQFVAGLWGEEWFIPRQQLAEELFELESWLGLSEPAYAQNLNDRLNAAGQFLVDHGASFPETQRLLGVFAKKNKGAPPQYRASTVSALDQRLSKNWSWAELTRNVCTCGEIQHNEHCEDKLRKRIGELKRFLKKYGWTLLK